MRHGLHAVADAQHRNAQLENRLRGLVRAFFVDTGMTAGQDDALEVAVAGVLANPVVAHIAGMDFTENVGFADATGNQLRDLRAEIKNEDFLVLHEDVEAFFVKKERRLLPGAQV